MILPLKISELNNDKTLHSTDEIGYILPTPTININDIPKCTIIPIKAINVAVFKLIYQSLMSINRCTTNKEPLHDCVYLRRRFGFRTDPPFGCKIIISRHKQPKQQKTNKSAFPAPTNQKHVLSAVEWTNHILVPFLPLTLNFRHFSSL